MAWPDREETARLLDEARRGKTEAVSRLLNEHREALRRAVAMRLDPALARRIDASDIVQDVLLEASQRMTNYLQHGNMPFDLWLRQLARDHIVDAHRRHRKAQRRSLDREQPIYSARSDQSSMDLAAAFIDPEKTPAAAAMRRELQQRFFQALAQLGEDDREIIVLRHIEQMANQDVATLLQLTEAAASMRYLRALRRLRQYLAPEDPAAPCPPAPPSD